MHMRALDLKEFYETLQGRVVQRTLRHAIREWWPDVRGQRVLGMGYTAPFLRAFADEAERVACLMPMQQGAVFWPTDGNCLACICHEGEWPIETNSVDKIIVVHASDNSQSLNTLLAESWRVLVGQGRLLLIVPNRAGLWARMDNTPFGHGTPYSMSQIRHILKDHMFVPERTEHALFFPPTTSRLTLLTAPLWEKIGQRFFNAFGGVNIIEATKQLYAGTPVAVHAALKRRMVVAAKPLS